MLRASNDRGLVLASALWPVDQTFGRAVRFVVLALLGSAMIAASAKITVPFWPVPLTMQTLAVLVVGAAYGSVLGGATLALYLLEGLIGLPVFATVSGPAAFAGPTGGYLIGFVFAAAIVGRLAEQGWDRSPLRTVAALILGNLAIYLCGVAWLAPFLASRQTLDLASGFTRALAVGVYPFLLGDGLKILLATAVLWGAWRVIDARR